MALEAETTADSISDCQWLKWDETALQQISLAACHDPEEQTRYCTHVHTYIRTYACTYERSSYVLYIFAYTYIRTTLYVHYVYAYIQYLTVIKLYTPDGTELLTLLPQVTHYEATVNCTHHWWCQLSFILKCRMPLPKLPGQPLPLGGALYTIKVVWTIQSDLLCVHRPCLPSAE